MTISRSQFLFSLLSVISFTALAQVPRIVTFKLKPDPEAAETSFSLRGNCAPLSWDRSTALTDTDGDGVFEATVTVTCANPILEYKYLRNEEWETNDNRVLLLQRDTTVTDTYNIAVLLGPKSLPVVPAGASAADFRLIKNALLALHPGIYRYRSTQEIEDFFRSMEAEFDQDQTYGQLFLLLSRMTSFLKCGHTFPNPFNQNALIRQALFEQPDKLPFTFTWMNGKMILLRDLSEHQLPPGSEIKSINDVPVAELLRTSMGLTKADGDNDGKRIRDLELTGLGKYEAFDLCLPLILPPGPGGYTIQWGESEQHVFSTISRAERKRLLQEKFGMVEPGYDEAWAFTFPAERAAYLRLPHFETWRMKKDWISFLDRAFDSVKRVNARHLIIDIRNNEGGNDAVIEKLARFIADRPVSIPRSEDRVRYERFPAQLSPYASSWDNRFENFAGRVRPQDDYFVFKRSQTPKKVMPQRSFSGKVWLLVNEANSSATFYLANILQQSGRATIVGQPTGGSKRGLNGGQIVFFRLPNSGIEIDIPVIGTFYNTTEQGGVIPDMLVIETLDDKLGVTDSTLRQVLDQIKGQ